MNAQRGRVLSIMYNVSRRFLCPPLSPFSNRFLPSLPVLLVRFFHARGAFSFLNVCVRSVWKILVGQQEPNERRPLRPLPPPLPASSLLLVPPLSSFASSSFLSTKLEARLTRSISSRAITPFQSFLLFFGGRKREKQRERETEREKERKRKRDREIEREREREGESEKKGSTKQRAAFFVLSRYLIAFPWQPPRNPRIVVSVEQK